MLATLTAPVAAAPSPTYKTAQEYYPYAHTTKSFTTPGKGSKVRGALMDAARAYFKTSTQFVVHGLRVHGEVAVAVISPYPATDGQMEGVTWVLWKGRWVVVSSKPVEDGAIPAINGATPAPATSAGKTTTSPGKTTAPPRTPTNEQPYAQASGRSTVPLVGQEGPTELSLDGSSSSDDQGITKYSWLVEDYSHDYAETFYGITVGRSLRRGLMPTHITLRVEDASGLYDVQRFVMEWTHPDGENVMYGVLSPIQ